MAMLICLLLVLLTTPISARRDYCLPGQSCFPSPAVLEDFNCSIGGRLIETTPYGSVCYGASYDAEACKALASKKKDFEYRLSLPAGSMFPVWEKNGPLGCPVPDLLSDGGAPPAVLSPPCTIGGMAAYVVNATTTEHISAAVAFAAKYQLRLRIKNTGHDYAGRSNGPGSLLIWTRHMNDIKLIEDYRNCNYGESQKLVSLGPGVLTGDLYAFSSAHNITTMGAFTATVGVAGGYVLGGGTGPLGPLLGMGVDNVVQFEVITADGKLKIANKCTNEDLFWALRGGGAAFGVVTRTYLKAHPSLTEVNTYFASITCKDRKGYESVVSFLLDRQVLLREAGYTGIWMAQNEGQKLDMLWIKANMKDPVSTHATSSFAEIEPIIRVGTCTAQVKTATFGGPTSWADAYKSEIWPIVKAGGPVGINTLDFSRLVSCDIMKNKEKLQEIKDYILALPDNFSFIWQNSAGVPETVPVDETAVHPEWRKAFAFIDTPLHGHWSGVTVDQLEKAQVNLEKATAIFNTTATYYNENSLEEVNWQESNWGANYRRLLDIKRAIDPNTVFSCRHCVGSEDGF